MRLMFGNEAYVWEGDLCLGMRLGFGNETKWFGNERKEFGSKTKGVGMR